MSLKSDWWEPEKGDPCPEVYELGGWLHGEPCALVADHEYPAHITDRGRTVWRPLTKAEALAEGIEWPGGG